MKAIITLSIVALAAALSARADISAKGGAAGLMKSLEPKTGAPAAAMSCGGCKSAFVRVTAPAFKGTSPTAALVERHGCGSCGTQWMTTGHGKAKADVAAHTCSGCLK